VGYRSIVGVAPAFVDFEHATVANDAQAVIVWGDDATG
jgi:hypothetical protein